ncbi:hypothetical protein MSM1_08015 [Mycobacterium sp. SM1]|uniref:hypothetical protein n=1 Tax=Mycobacterium sp. SM1 TaxID=2816243 RepID=UPI001BCAA5A5|nr:hypothetical protein [Mycobacterium sp. SM1]MBS4728290.1 hypothetical protein [Mycobacterium sp. SM1]
MTETPNRGRATSQLMWQHHSAEAGGAVGWLLMPRVVEPKADLPVLGDGCLCYDTIEQTG